MPAIADKIRKKLIKDRPEHGLHYDSQVYIALIISSRITIRDKSFPKCKSTSIDLFFYRITLSSKDVKNSSKPNRNRDLKPRYQGNRSILIKILLCLVGMR